MTMSRLWNIRSVSSERLFIDISWYAAFRRDLITLSITFGLNPNFIIRSPDSIVWPSKRFCHSEEDHRARVCGREGATTTATSHHCPTESSLLRTLATFPSPRSTSAGIARAGRQCQCRIPRCGEMQDRTGQ